MWKLTALKWSMYILLGFLIRALLDWLGTDLVLYLLLVLYANNRVDGLFETPNQPEGKPN